MDTIEWSSILGSGTGWRRDEEGAGWRGLRGEDPQLGGEGEGREQDGASWRELRLDNPHVGGEGREVGLRGENPQLGGGEGEEEGKDDDNEGLGAAFLECQVKLQCEDVDNCYL